MLDDARTEGVDLVPTKAFFKPVLIIGATIDRAHAEILECAYLFNGETPVEFEGAHHLTAALPAAEITLAGKTVAPVVIKTEKVVKFTLSREEKKGMRLTLRAHLKEDADKLFQLLTFLSQLNKEPFQFTVRSAQKSLLEVIPSGAPGGDPNHKFPLPDPETGFYDLKYANKRPCESKNLDMWLYTLQIDDEKFIASWGINWKNKQAAHEDLHADNQDYPSSAEALKVAAETAWRWLRQEIVPKGVKEIAEHEAGLVFLQDFSPELARQDKGLKF